MKKTSFLLRLLSLIILILMVPVVSQAEYIARIYLEKDNGGLFDAGAIQFKKNASSASAESDDFVDSTTEAGCLSEEFRGKTERTISKFSEFALDSIQFLQGSCYVFMKQIHNCVYSSSEMNSDMNKRTYERVNEISNIIRLERVQIYNSCDNA